jgi:gliding motility-associated-like protein
MLKINHSENVKRVLLLIILQFIISFSFGLNVTIIESRSFLPSHDMDREWRTVLTGMGHSPTISPQSTLDNNTFFSSTDILIISSGVINLAMNRVNTILQFIQSGKPVYLQSEHLPTRSTNQAFQTIVSSLGGSFTWNNQFSGDLGPVNVLGTFSTTNNLITSLDYYWYSVSGSGDCNTIHFLESGGEFHGFQYIPSNSSFGSIITCTDQDWIRAATSPQLMENIITHLISPLPNPNDSLTLNLGKDTTLCQGEILTLDATTPFATYLWHDNSTSPTFNVTQQGTYWVQVTDHCGTTADSINVSFNPIPSVNMGNDTTLCQGEALTLDATIANATYLWQDNSTNPTFNVTQQGTYWVQVTNNCGTTADSINVSFNPIPSVNMGNDTTLCQGEALTLDATIANATYLWQDNSTNPTFNVTQQGTYWVQVTDHCGTTADSINVSFNPIPSVNMGNDTTLCQGEALTLDATIANATYLWQDNSTNPTFNVTQQGTYWVQVTNNCGTTADSINVSFNPIPSVNMGNDTTLCQGEALTLDATIANATYLWQDNSTNPTFNVTQQGTYWVQVTNNCGTTTDTINISLNPIPTVNLGKDTTLCQGETLTLDATTTNATYLWQDNSTNPTFNVTQQGTYWVQISNDCEAIYDTLVIEFEDCDCAMYFPNAFTPNYDGINDKFSPISICEFSEYNLMIFNRWGEKMFESSIHEDSWDGTFRGEMAPIGQYVYLVIYRFKDKNITETKFGSMTLVR